MSSHYRRRKFRLLTPRLQLRLMAGFGGIALLALVLQFLLFQHAIGEAAVVMQGSDTAVVDRLTGELQTTLLISVGVLLPAVFAVGTSAVLRFVGPLFRFKKWLEEVLDGKDPGALKLRPGDDLQDLAQLIDRIAAERRAANARADRSQTAAERDAA